MATAEVRRAAERSRTEAEGRTTRHSFSFGAHYDPANLSFGPLVAHNDELLPPGTGYAPHRHADVEIVTWVVSGALRHADHGPDDDRGADRSHDTVLVAGGTQVLWAGRGVVHSETAAAEVPTRFVQAWLRAEATDRREDPSYASAAPASVPGGWAVLAGEGGLPLRTRGARLLLGTTGPTPLAVPAAHRVHLFVVAGTVRAVGPGHAAGATGSGPGGSPVAEHVLADGDALRLVGEPTRWSLASLGPAAQVLAWLLP